MDVTTLGAVTPTILRVIIDMMIDDVKSMCELPLVLCLERDGDGAMAHGDGATAGESQTRFRTGGSPMSYLHSDDVHVSMIRYRTHSARYVL